ncbi:MAG: lipoate--protein ligase family protein [Candidatus Diapherotrites archaeon]|uniref:Lipoate--protein ligase family protein n=1 Tax=Candidatus Iainarchaeum sp. TaxID=3101447 RepID=A0A8T4CBB5_9ARCH|nr:lipoate--protein ligase family protein [Candidatus Diapherotrites archaeon]
MNMALDEACAHEVILGNVSPTIRFYRWKPSAVTIGYFQSLEQEVDVKECAKQGVDIVRRRTGGGAVYHDYAGEITYSVIAPEKMFANNIVESYQQVAEWIIAGLGKLNVKAEFVPINDLVVSGKKISGNAQTRRSGILQMHGTILCDVDVDKMFSLLRVPDEKMKGKTITMVKERVTSLKQHGADDYTKIYHALHEGFIENKKITEGKWTKEEKQNAQILAEEKYSAQKWVGMR